MRGLLVCLVEKHAFKVTHAPHVEFLPSNVINIVNLNDGNFMLFICTFLITYVGVFQTILHAFAEETCEA